MEEKKRHDDEIKRKEREEEEKLERRLQEQQEKMKREYEEEQNKKKEKEQAVTHQNVLIFHFILICPVEIEATGGACQEAGQAAAGDGQAEERGGHETTRREEERLRWWPRPSPCCVQWQCEVRLPAHPNHARPGGGRVQGGGHGHQASQSRGCGPAAEHAGEHWQEARVSAAGGGTAWGDLEWLSRALDFYNIKSSWHLQ